MKKKIGILTFHNVPNYGATLQAFALKTYLEKIVYADVNVIDFQCKGNSNEFIPEAYFEIICKSNNRIKNIIKRLLLKKFFEKKYLKKYQLFSNFVKYKLCLKPYTDTLYNDYDYIFCGSDQIWNGEITGGYQLPYFGADRKVSATATVAAYAASCGDISDYDDKEQKVLFELIKKMDYVAVREKTLADELNKQNIKAVNTMDPTFLLDKEEYTQSFGLKISCEKKYVLEYALRKSSVLDDVAAKISRDKNIPIIKICGYARMSPEKGIFDAGPEEFLNLLASAEYVVTNSFHGTALSIIFEKDFNVILPTSRKGRITDLLESFELGDRICENTDDVMSDSIDYNVVNNTREKYVDDSKKYIVMVMGSENIKHE